MLAQIYASSKYCSWIIFAIVLFSCESSRNDAEFVFEEAKVVYIDSVLLEDENIPFGFALNEKLYNDSILVLGDGSFSAITVFNTRSGALIGTFSSDSIITYPIPPRSYTNSFVSGDTLFLLNDLTKQIFAFSFDKKFLFDIKLTIPSDSFLFDYRGLFEKKGENWFISSKVDGPLSEVFKKSKLVSVFDSKGNYVRSFGEYPEAYSEGPLVLSKNNNELLKGNRVYLVNGAGVPILKEFDFSGNLIEETEIKSNFFKPEIGYYSDDPFEAPLTDQVTNLAADLNSAKNVIYLTYFTFVTRELEDRLTSYRLMLMKIDMDRKVISETELLGAEYIMEIHELLPYVKGDTLHLVVREQDENLYLKRFTFK